MSFLDEVEESSRADISSLASSVCSSRHHAAAAGRDLSGHRSAGGFGSGGLAQDAAAFQSRMSLLEIEVKDKRKTIETLTRALQAVKDHEKQALEELGREWDDKLRKQATHFEVSIERQLKMVDRLLNDKTELTKRCELFTEELKVAEKKFQRKLEDLDEQASKELERQKKNWMASERLRRESWEKEKIKEIKEMTIKGLQPDIERILSERKQDRRRHEEREQEALDALRRELQDRAQGQLREQREKLAQEHERALEEEREVHRRKMREEFERFTSQLQDERARCAADLLSERRRHERAALEATDNTDGRIREAVAQEHAKGEAQVREVLERVAAIEKRHRDDMDDLRRQLEGEAAERCRELEAQAKVQLERREVELRQELVQERDRRLDVVMERLSREHVEQQQQLRDEAEADLRRFRDEAGAEAARLGAELAEARRRGEELGNRLAALELAARNLEDRHTADARRIEDLEQRLAEAEAQREATRREAEQALERHRDELWRASELKEREAAGHRTEAKRAQEQAAEAFARADECERAAARREEEVIGDLEARVKRALQAKDETIAELRSRCAAAENKVREFEYLLARQREELLSEITRGSQR